MRNFFSSISAEMVMTIAVAIVIIATVWSSIIVTRKFYKERRFIRLGFCYVCYLAIIIIVVKWWCMVLL